MPTQSWGHVQLPHETACPPALDLTGVLCGLLRAESLRCRDLGKTRFLLEALVQKGRVGGRCGGALCSLSPPRALSNISEQKDVKRRRMASLQAIPCRQPVSFRSDWLSLGLPSSGETGAERGPGARGSRSPGRKPWVLSKGQWWGETGPRGDSSPSTGPVLPFGPLALPPQR